MANTNILELPVAIGLTGAEYAPVVQAGTTKRAQVSAFDLTGSLPGSAQTANTGLFGPTSGAAALPTFRALVNADLYPTPNFTRVGVGIIPSDLLLDVVGANSGNGQARFRYDALGSGLLVNQVASGGIVVIANQAASDLYLQTNVGTSTFVLWRSGAFGDYTSGDVGAAGALSGTSLWTGGVNQTGGTAIIHPNQGGIPSGNLAQLNKNAPFVCDQIGISSADPTTLTNTVLLGGSAPNAGDVIAFRLTWTGTGSPVTISYTATGGESLATITAALQTTYRANATIAAQWGAGYVTSATANASGATFGFNSRYPISSTLVISNLSTGSGNVTQTINGTLRAPSAGSNAYTALDVNPYYGLTRNVSGRNFAAGDIIGGVFFISGDSAGGVANIHYGIQTVVITNASPSTPAATWTHNTPNGTLSVDGGAWLSHSADATYSSSDPGAGYLGSRLGLKINGTNLFDRANTWSLLNTFSLTTDSNAALTTGSIVTAGGISVAKHINAGLAYLGTWVANTNYAVFGNNTLDQTAAGNYALVQGASGDTHINSAAGQNTVLTINNATFLTLASTGIISTTLTTDASSSTAASVTLAGGLATAKGIWAGTFVAHGVAGSALGSSVYYNATSGSVTVSPVAGALGSVALALPNASGTFAVSASAPLTLNATTGALAITAAALSKVDDTNVTLTLGGAPTTALLAATSLTLGWTGQLGLTRGGTAASLTASNGGIIYSTASAMAILSATATARQMLQSGSSTTPAWSTTTWPATTTANRILYSSATSVIGEITSANSSILVTDSGGIPSLSTTLPAYTLGGTVSGGGNQINNVIIGTSTPLAGSFTTLTLSGALTTTGPLTINSSTNGASGHAVFELNSAIGAADSTAIQFSLTNQASSYGMIFGFDGAGVSTSGYHGANTGWFINVQAGPIIFGTTNAARAWLSAAGGLSVGSSTDAGAGGVLVNGTLRINQAPAAMGASAKTFTSAADSTTNIGHYFSVNLNGTTYYIPCSSVAPTG